MSRTFPVHGRVLLVVVGVWRAGRVRGLSTSLCATTGYPERGVTEGMSVDHRCAATGLPHLEGAHHVARDPRCSETAVPKLGILDRT